MGPTLFGFLKQSVFEAAQMRSNPGSRICAWRFLIHFDAASSYVATDSHFGLKSALDSHQCRGRWRTGDMFRLIVIGEFGHGTRTTARKRTERTRWDAIRA